MTRSEREVAELLKEIGIKWSYEHPVFVWDENHRPRTWTPDFYLKQFGIYVEICGSEDFDYEYRRRIFENNGYKVIFLHLYKERKKWMFHLMNYLDIIMNYRYGKINKILKN